MFSRLRFLKLICILSTILCLVTLIAQEKSPQSKPRSAPESVNSPRSQRMPNTAVEALPKGLVVFDGVHFKASHYNIIGTRAARAGGSYPGSSSNLPLGRTGRKIHILHTADHAASDRSEYFWRPVLHYLNGEQ